MKFILFQPEDIDDQANKENFLAKRRLNDTPVKKSAPAVDVNHVYWWVSAVSRTITQDNSVNLESAVVRY